MHQSSTVEKVKTCFTIEKAVFKAFKEISIREGAEMNLKVEKFMQQYNLAHGNGNPQLRISTYAKPDEPSPLRVLCDFLNGALSDGMVHCRRRGLWVKGLNCYSCEKNSLRKQK